MTFRLYQAIEFALRAHAGQKRKGKDVPYITHPFAVAMMLAQTGCSETILISGLLHDVVEDTHIRLEEVAEKFGDAVADIVAACSEDKRLSWEVRKRHTLETLPNAPLAVKLVVCADKLHNLRDLQADYQEVGDRVWERFRYGREHQAWYYRGLSEAFSKEIQEGIYPSLFRAFSEEVAAMFGSSEE